jgi:hypothetical protein
VQRLGYINIKGTSEVSSKKIIWGSSLVAWWLEFQPFPAIARFLSLVGKLTSCKLHSMAKNKKKTYSLTKVESLNIM